MKKKNENFVLATEVWRRVLERLGISLQQNPTIVTAGTTLFDITQADSKLDIRISVSRNRSIHRYRSRSHSHPSRSSQESIVLEGSIFKNGNGTGKNIVKKVSIWKDENVPERIAFKRIEEVVEEASRIKQELYPELHKFLIIENKEKEFEFYLKSRYKDCGVVINSPERATLKYKYFDITIGRDEKVHSFYLRDIGLFIWDLASVIQDIRPTREGKRSSRLFRIDHIPKTKLVPKNEDTRGGKNEPF